MPENTMSEPPPWFDEQYWRDLVFQQLDIPGAVDSRWSSAHGLAIGRAVDFYIRTTVAHGPRLDPRIVARWRQAIPGLMRQFVGEWAGTIAEGPDTVEQPGTVSIEIHNDQEETSGGFWRLANDEFRGLIKLNTTQDNWYLATVLLAHELGHVLGFHHVDDSDDIMCTGAKVTGGDCSGRIWKIARFDPTFTPRLERHAQLAYQIGRKAYPGVPASWITQGGRGGSFPRKDTIRK